MGAVLRAGAGSQDTWALSQFRERVGSTGLEWGRGQGELGPQMPGFHTGLGRGPACVQTHPSCAEVLHDHTNCWAVFPRHCLLHQVLVLSNSICSCPTGSYLPIPTPTLPGCHVSICQSVLYIASSHPHAPSVWLSGCPHTPCLSIQPCDLSVPLSNHPYASCPANCPAVYTYTHIHLSIFPYMPSLTCLYTPSFVHLSILFHPPICVSP